MVLLAAMVALTPVSGIAQEEVMEWEGTLERPHKKVKNVEFVVIKSGARTAGITMRHEGTDYPFKDVEVSDDRISFSWTPGNAGDIQCVVILHEDGSYRGTCPLSESGNYLGITMLPKHSSE